MPLRALCCCPRRTTRAPVAVNRCPGVDGARRRPNEPRLGPECFQNWRQVELAYFRADLRRRWTNKQTDRQAGRRPERPVGGAEGTSGPQVDRSSRRPTHQVGRRSSWSLRKRLPPDWLALTCPRAAGQRGHLLRGPLRASRDVGQTNWTDSNLLSRPIEMCRSAAAAAACETVRLTK